MKKIVIFLSLLGVSALSMGQQNKLIDTSSDAAFFGSCTGIAFRMLTLSSDKNQASKDYALFKRTLKWFSNVPNGSSDWARANSAAMSTNNYSNTQIKQAFEICADVYNKSR